MAHTALFFSALLVCFAQAAERTSSTLYALKGLEDPKTELLPKSFESCERRCDVDIDGLEEGPDMQDALRNAFICRKQARDQCQADLCNLGYQCFTETKELVSADLDSIFGEGLCRLERLNEKGTNTKAVVLEKDDVEVCKQKKYEHIDFTESVTKGFLGDRSFYFQQPGSGDAKYLWEAVLRFLDGGLDEAGLVGRGGKTPTEKMDMFCRQFKGDDTKLKLSAQRASFDLPRRTYNRMCPFDRAVARHISRGLLYVFAELINTMSDVLREKNKLTKFVPGNGWCKYKKGQASVCRYWCRKPKNWAKLAETAKALLTKFENCVAEGAFASAKDDSCKLPGFRPLLDKIESLRTKDNPFAEWYMTASNMMHGCPSEILNKAELKGVIHHDMDGVMGFITDPSAPKAPALDRLSAGNTHVCGITNDGSVECFGFENASVIFPTKGKFVQVSTASDSAFPWTCGLTDDGVAECWGTTGEDSITSKNRIWLKNKGKYICRDSPHFQCKCKSKHDKKGKGRWCSLSHTNIVLCGKFRCEFAPPSIDKSEAHGRFVQISVGQPNVNYACGVSVLGAIYCWGLCGKATCNDHQPRVPINGEKYLKVSTGENYACGFTDTGYLECFGSGVGPHIPESILPGAVDPSASKFVDVSSAHLQTCGLTDVGSIICYSAQKKRDDPYKSLGFNGRRKIPKAEGAKYVRVYTYHTANSSATPYIGHTCGLTDGGTAECWGDNSWDNEVNSYQPIKYSKTVDFAQLALSRQRTCGLGMDGKIFCQGAYVSGIKNNDYAPPTKGDKFVQISLGRSHSCGLASDGQIHCIGADGEPSEEVPGLTSQGAQWLRDFRSSGPRLLMGSLSAKFSRMCTGPDFTCGLRLSRSKKVNGTIYCFGSNIINYVRNPWKSQDKSQFVDLDCGGLGACGLTASGKIECRGIDIAQINRNKLLSPAPGKGKRFVAISAGNHMTCGVSDTNEVTCFTDKESAQYFPIPENFDEGQKIVKISMAGSAFCAILEKGALKCIFTRNETNRFVDSLSRKYNKPRKIIDHTVHPMKGTGQRFIDVGVGWGTMICGVTNWGIAQCFGSNQYGGPQFYDPKYGTYPERFVSVSVGKTHACGLTNFGKSQCWMSDIVGESNGFKQWTPKPHTFPPPGCIQGSKGLNCALRDSGVHLEAGIFVDEHEEFPFVIHQGVVVDNVIISTKPMEEIDLTDAKDSAAKKKYIEEAKKRHIARDTIHMSAELEGNEIALRVKGWFEDYTRTWKGASAKVDRMFAKLGVFSGTVLPYAPHRHFSFSGSSSESGAPIAAVNKTWLKVPFTCSSESNFLGGKGHFKDQIKGLKDMGAANFLKDAKKRKKIGKIALTPESREKRKKRKEKREKEFQERMEKKIVKERALCKQIYEGKILHFMHKPIGKASVLKKGIVKRIKVELHKKRFPVCMCHVEGLKQPVKCHEATNAIELSRDAQVHASGKHHKVITQDMELSEPDVRRFLRLAHVPAEKSPEERHDFVKNTIYPLVKNTIVEEGFTKEVAMAFLKRHVPIPTAPSDVTFGNKEVPPPPQATGAAAGGVPKVKSGRRLLAAVRKGKNGNCKCKAKWWYEHFYYYGCDVRRPGGGEAWCYTKGTCEGKQYRTCTDRVQELEKKIKDLEKKVPGGKILKLQKAVDAPIAKSSLVKSGSDKALKVTDTDNANLNGVNSVDVKVGGLNGKTKKLVADGVTEVQYIFEIKGKEKFFKEEELRYDNPTGMIQAVYDCSKKGSAKKICSMQKKSVKDPVNLKVFVYQSDFLCCKYPGGSKGTSFTNCQELKKGCKQDLTVSREFSVTIKGFGYDVAEIKKGRRKLLMQRFRGGGGS